MPLTGPVSEGKKFFCPACGALYSVTYKAGAKKETVIAKCVVCLKVMAKRIRLAFPSTRSFTGLRTREGAFRLRASANSYPP